jgi:archaellum component FlaC
MAKAVIDLNDQATAETNHRFDRIERIIEDRFDEVKAEIGGVKADLGGVKADIGEVRADLGGVRADLGGVKADLAELKSTINRIDARVEQQAAWIAGDERRR